MRIKVKNPKTAEYFKWKITWEIQNFDYLERLSEFDFHSNGILKGIFYSITTYVQFFFQLFSNLKLFQAHRVVVSAIGGPLYFLVKGVAILFNAVVPRPQYSCKSSLELKGSIEKLTIPDNYELISLNVISLFTNINSDIIIAALKTKWKNIKNHNPIFLQEFLDGIIFLLHISV